VVTLCCCVSWLQGWLDTFDDQLPPLRNFILPSGGKAAAHLHMARSVSAMHQGLWIHRMRLSTLCWLCSVCKQLLLASTNGPGMLPVTFANSSITQQPQQLPHSSGPSPMNDPLQPFQPLFVATCCPFSICITAGVSPC
jgi:hypothetical protein